MTTTENTGHRAAIHAARTIWREDWRGEETVDVRDAEIIVGELFDAAVAGADAENVELRECRRGEDGTTYLRTRGEYGDGQTANLWHIRDADGEFVDAIDDIAHTPYDEIEGRADGVDWYGGEVEDEMRAAATRHRVSFDQVALAMEPHIPTGRTPAESIDRAAEQAAEWAKEDQ